MLAFLFIEKKNKVSRITAFKTFLFKVRISRFKERGLTCQKVSFSDWYTAILRKVVGRNVHATIPKGNMGYDQYTVPDTAAVQPTFFCFP